MTGAGDAFRVESSDGTRLAVWPGGAGPPMLLVHGSFGDHTAWEIPLGELNRRFSTFAMDRRGFGRSDDRVPYSIESEFDDVAVVVEALARTTGGPVTVFGHSYGANCAMGGAARASAVGHLILYEPSLGMRYPPGAIEAAEAMLIDGDREGAVERLLLDVLEMSQGSIDLLRASSRWPNLLENVHTAPRECRAEEAWVYEPGQFAGIGAPTLFLSGVDSPEPVHAATRRAVEAVPTSTVRTLAGHGHFAHRTDPALVSDIIYEFAGSGS